MIVVTMIVHNDKHINKLNANDDRPLYNHDTDNDNTNNTNTINDNT